MKKYNHSMNKHPNKFLFLFQLASSVNPKETIDMGNMIQKTLDGKSRSTTFDRKLKGKTLANLQKLVSESDGTAPINALKYFNGSVLFAQRQS